MALYSKKSFLPERTCFIRNGEDSFTASVVKTTEIFLLHFNQTGAVIFACQIRCLDFLIGKRKSDLVISNGNDCFSLTIDGTPLAVLLYSGSERKLCILGNTISCRLIRIGKSGIRCVSGCGQRHGGNEQDCFSVLHGFTSFLTV